ncbi:hypothetical protein GUITHDRAFT_116299 [Guillardia theta CCMP2712]|uniref:Phosphoglycerate mutase n=1 Tax=Guillardia theta (strain CCMP2712) TaxID=905079 RepID=L1IN14_GUITC|nr:hypothetical protein GUITHDRAFT_116299 [Guillardia theta CCMP2712]EKX37492.1 hypothetical protein GUITHDRAFT_116299 [Guillardia theta CCMP2712]|eukprot:XP_005824472.1 hypothetical protein GUITHDRAFT_116299 [Guillardia theta CCMP2712]
MFAPLHQLPDDDEYNIPRSPSEAEEEEEEGNAKRFLPCLTKVTLLGTLFLVLLMSVLLVGDISSRSSPICQAEVIIVRHGEKPADSSDNGLSMVGHARAVYISNCSLHVSRILDRGPPNRLVAARTEPGKSSRAFDTLLPLSEQLGLPVESSIGKKDMSSLLLLLSSLSCGDTALVSWHHELIPDIVRSLGAPNAEDFAAWPDQCPSESWPEPSWLPGNSVCYDEVWKVRITAAGKTAGRRKKKLKGKLRGWYAGNVERFQQGFAGVAGGRCRQDFQRIS